MENTVRNIVELNGFEQQLSGVYAAPGSAASFNYSDGEETERTLANILSTTQDLSSRSAQLEAQIIDWPTEYHLSSTRANLLRPLDLSASKRVLELGCGCGSISRYLAEQSHLSIDSVEGSPVRASLAAQRCKGLDNIRFLTANFNQLDIPENHYDLVLFVGVLEYAGRFSGGKTDQQAVLDLLQLAKRSLTPNGVAVIAIENRTGLKYALGAKEDHYALPFVGLDDYPESTGIRTYDHAQWLDLIAQSPFAAQTTLLPFPDYKIPHLLINGESADLDRHEVEAALAKVESRDYCSPQRSFPLGDSEPRLWQAVVEANTLTQLSNSYLLLLGEPADIAKLAPKKDVTDLDKPIFDYVAAAEQQNQAPSPQARINELSQQLQASQTHAEELEKIVQISQQRLTFIEQSFVWRSLRAIRRMLGRG